MLAINGTRSLFCAQNLGGVGAQRAKHGRQCGNERGKQNGARGQSDDFRQ